MNTLDHPVFTVKPRSTKCAGGTKFLTTACLHDFFSDDPVTLNTGGGTSTTTGIVL
jgi:hypothetical protein